MCSAHASYYFSSYYVVAYGLISILLVLNPVICTGFFNRGFMAADPTTLNRVLSKSFPPLLGDSISSINLLSL